MKSITGVSSAAVFLVIALAAAPTSVAAEAPPRVPEVVTRRFVPARLDAGKLDGVLGARLRTNLEGRLLRVDEPGLLDGFRKRPGSHPWIGEHIGKFLDAAARTWVYSRDPRLKTLMDRMAKSLIATQESDGYLGTYAPAERWTSWDVWVHKYDLMGLLAYHRVTGDEAALKASVRVGDLLIATFGKPVSEGGRDLIAAGTHVGMAATSVLGPMVELYRQTGDERYLAFCRRIVATYDQPNGPKILSTLRATGSVFKTANGKAYEMISNLVGLVQLHGVTGDRTLLEPVIAAWKDIVQNRLYLTGSTSSREHFQEAHRLPGEARDNIAETCVTVNWIELNQQLLRLTGEPQYADEIEKTVVNHLLAAQDARNGDFCYYTPLNGRKPYTPGINCCVSSGPRGISLVPELTWGLLDGAPAVLLYGPGRVTLEATTASGPVKVELRQRTNFPESGRVTLEVRPARAARFPIHVRVPAWASRFSVTGEAQPAKPGTLLRLERDWKKNDSVTIDMDLPVRLVDGGPSYPGHVAIARGPQILAFDATVNPGIDNPKLAALASTNGAPALVDARGKLPRNYGGAQAWTVPGEVIAKVDVAAPARTPRELVLVPYADARVSRVWLLAGDRLEATWAALRDARAKRPRLPIKRTPASPTVDGNLADATWKSASFLPLAVKSVQSNSGSRATFATAWDDDALYVAVRVEDPTPESRPDDTWSDRVDLALDGNGDAGGQFDDHDVFVAQRWDAPASTTGIKRAASRHPGGYTVEIAVPWSRLKLRPTPGHELGFDVRNHDQGRLGVDDDGDWYWAKENPDLASDTSTLGIARLEP